MHYVMLPRVCVCVYIRPIGLYNSERAKQTETPTVARGRAFAETGSVWKSLCRIDSTMGGKGHGAHCNAVTFRGEIPKIKN